MNNIEIMTERSYQHWPSWDVVYEWEDVMAEELDSDLVDLHRGSLGQVSRIIRKSFRKLNLAPNKFICHGRKYKLAWIMDARIYKEYTYHNIIPIFLDFGLNMVDEIVNATNNLPFYWVTSFAIYKELRKKTNRVHYLPITVADKWIKKIVPQKQIDVIQFGRKNDILHKYMLNYCKAHPDIEYIYQTGDGTLTYTSSTRGIIGKFETRDSYMDMIAKSKISLVSTPGIDKSKDFGGIDFFTPRFYESAAHYCHLIGRFPDNEEAEYIGINEVCSNIDSEKEFIDTVDYMLQQSNRDNLYKYEHFLKENRTSNRLKEMKIILENVSDNMTI